MLAAPAPIAGCHPLHALDRQWPQSNCSLDLWIEYFHHLGFPPEAVMGALVGLDDEGDQFTFAKFDTSDIARMSGIDVLELALFDRLDSHIAGQTARGHLVMVEVDGFDLPDTRATSYHRLHTKTSIGIDWIDPAARRLNYFHNSGHYQLGPDDYVAVLGLDLPAAAGAERLFPYTEFAKNSRPALTGDALREAALAALRLHLSRAPASNPFVSYQARFAADFERLIERDQDYFHLYAFSHFRQFGAAFELLGAFARWLLGADGGGLAQHCDQIAQAAKLLQFRTARCSARRRFDPCEGVFADLQQHWNGAFEQMRREFG